MKITGVTTIPLRGATHDTGWPGGTDPNEEMNTLLEIHTDDGLTGIGSCFTGRPWTRRNRKPGSASASARTLAAREGQNGSSMIATRWARANSSSVAGSPVGMSSRGR